MTSRSPTSLGDIPITSLQGNGAAPYALVPGRKKGGAVPAWILASGAWNDAAPWNDTATWRDS